MTLFFGTLLDQWAIHLCLMVFTVSWCGATPTSPVWWRMQGRRRSGAVCPCCVWKVCSGSSQPASSATQTRWPSSSLPWVRHVQFNYKNCELNVLTWTVCNNYMTFCVFSPEISEDDDEPDEGNVTEINFFYIRQFQVLVYTAVYVGFFSIWVSPVITNFSLALPTEGAVHSAKQKRGGI